MSSCSASSWEDKFSGGGGGDDGDGDGEVVVVRIACYGGSVVG